MTPINEECSTCNNTGAERCFSSFLNNTQTNTHIINEVEGDSNTHCDDIQRLLSTIRQGVIGDQDMFDGPYGARKITYCDYIASGRALSFLEDYIAHEVLPMYGNTHTSTSSTGLQSTLFRQEARDIIGRCVHTCKDDVVLFTGSGATAAITTFANIVSQSTSSSLLVFTGPYEHHSNMLIWRELNCKIIVIPERNDGAFDMNALRIALEKHHSFTGIKIGTFSAASNITGITVDTDGISCLLHEHGALACWDYATAAPYVHIDMNPGRQNHSAKDAIFISAHKFVGGVGAPGILVVKKRLLKNRIPSTPGGGAIFYVDQEQHRYLDNFEEREEAGTPDIIGSIRAGLAFTLKQAVGTNFLQIREKELSQRVLSAFNAVPNLYVLGNNCVHRLPIFSIMIRYNTLYLHYNFVSALLNDLFGIQSRGGCACAGPYAQHLLGIDLTLARRFEHEILRRNELLRPGFCRISIPFFSSDAEVSFIIDAVTFVATHGWQFLSEYGYFVESGEWRHRTLMTHMKDRRWLGHISYRDGTFAYKSQRRMMTITNDTLNYINDAKHQLNLIVAASKKSSSILNQEMFLSDEAKCLRWFMLPSESRAVLSASSVSAMPLQNSPFYVRRYDTVSAVKSLSTEPTSGDEDDDDDDDDEDILDDVVNDDERGFFEANDNDDKSVNNCIDESAVVCRNCFHIHTNNTHANADTIHACLTCDCVHFVAQRKQTDFNALSRLTLKVNRLVRAAVRSYNMIEENDRVMVAVSGGKDSLTLIHALLALRRTSPVKFDVGACTIDPQTPEYDPSPLKAYFAALGVPYMYESQPIIEAAKTCMVGTPSLCSFCARMKRGILYSSARRNGYNVIAMGQHLDDLAESFMMSAFFNGQLRTMKANYHVEENDLRVIRPLVLLRERVCHEFATLADLPVIFENCPACFEAPQERQRVKLLLASQEHIHPGLFSSLLRTMRPLMALDNWKLQPKTQEATNDSASENVSHNDEERQEN